MSDFNPDREFLFSKADFDEVRSLLRRRVGIAFNDSKKTLVYSRLSRRLRALGLASFRDYLNYLRHHDEEWQPFTNALTTNLTAFFREQHHFDILSEYLLQCTERPIRIWCAASSTGEEPYSLAITAAEAFGTPHPPVEIIASDVDTRVLEIARHGLYEVQRIDEIPLPIKRRWFMRGKFTNEGLARISPNMQALIDFRHINLFDSDWGFGQPFDVIFCRNVMIYFDKPTQLQLIARMVQALKPGGLYFAGHSESFQLGDSLRPLGRTVYRAGTASDRAASA
ncbi:MAG: chemotaxis protein CheR [Verrucomicrobiaceae bacterium]|nr:chemotaxis protein CheR [Verrucomicrobiaceae bacterium]